MKKQANVRNAKGKVDGGKMLFGVMVLSAVLILGYLVFKSNTAPEVTEDPGGIDVEKAKELGKSAYELGKDIVGDIKENSEKRRQEKIEGNR